MTDDRIEREILIAAPIARVWAILTESQHISRWFGPGTADPQPTPIELRPGGEMVLDHGEYGRFRTSIVSVEPPHYFSYRWASAYPGELAVAANSTLVEFRLTEVDEKTRLEVVETGFATLVIPPDRVSTAGFGSHSEGWTMVMQQFATYAEQQ